MKRRDGSHPEHVLHADARQPHVARCALAGAAAAVGLAAAWTSVPDGICILLQSLFRVVTLVKRVA